MAWNVANFVALAVVFALLAVISVILRFWARTITKVTFGVHDALIIPAALLVVGIGVAMIVGACIGEMAQHQTNEIGPQGPIFTEGLKNYEICNYVLQLLPLVSLGLSRTSVLCFYRKIFHIHQRFLVVNTILIVFVVAWTVSFFFATVFQCKDPATIWTTFEYERTNCVDTISFYYAVSISGFITDILILISPLPIIGKLKLPLKSRIAVAGILLLGAVVCGAGIARFVTFINIGRGIVANINDLTYFTTPVFAWTMIESSLAVVGANLPLLRPLLQRKTYTSQNWSLLRSWRPKRSLMDYRGHISLDSLARESLKPDVQVTGKGQPSQQPLAADAETLRIQQLEASGRGIMVQHRIEVV
ncbi:hypothetical protein GGS23DRAFT_586125 [Durotheca rogersii]|uniref:uncharacterized protein n=1 Tax=Durotheca rogersii TaxID=419775 RepID=UPI00221E453A|nr:uncharacterized protein GGS23DRAFT_586125 [Durotheca rogersii]KAI5859362.1 hypothetical protein GGS23DRAFT_586125 [Durotheca rogersii]